MDQQSRRQDNGKHSTWTAKRKKKLNGNNLRTPWDNIKHTNTYIIGISEGQERKT